MQIKKLLHVFILGITIGLFGSANNSHAADLGKFVPSVESVKELLKTAMDNSNVQSAVSLYNKYPQGLTTAAYSLMELISRPNNIEKISGVISTFTAVYTQPMIMKLLQDVAVIDKDFSYTGSPIGTIAAYLCLSRIVYDVTYKATNYLSKKCLKAVNNNPS